MAYLQQSLHKALRAMAEGSQSDERTVADASEILSSAYTTFLDDSGREGQLAALQPHLGDLLQAARWLYPCILPSSSLGPRVQLAAQKAWDSCMCLALECMDESPVPMGVNTPAFLSLIEAHSRLQVPGELGR
jgi:hypothetical protein